MTKNTKLTNVSALDFVLTNCELPEDIHAKLATMKETFSRKSGGKKTLTSTQKENLEIKEQIVAGMEPGTLYSASEISKMFDLGSNQKASALLRQLVAAELVTRIEEKGRAKFMLKED